MAESTLASKRLQLGTGNRPVPTLGTYPAHHSSAKPIPWPWGCSSAGVPGLSPRCLAAAGMGGSVPVLVGEPRLSCPRACGSRRIRPRGGNREDDPAQPPAGLALSLSCPVGPRRGAARRAAGPCRGFPKKGLNSSVEFATSLTTPFPVRGCVRPLFFSLSLFFSLPSPCPQTRRSRRCRAPPEPAGVTLAGTRRRSAMARLQVRTHRCRLPPCVPPVSFQQPRHGVGWARWGFGTGCAGGGHRFVPRFAEAGVAGGGCHAAQGIVPAGALGESGMRGAVSFPWPVFSIALGFARVGTSMPRLPPQLAQGRFGDCFGRG